MARSVCGSVYVLKPINTRSALGLRGRAAETAVIVRGNWKKKGKSIAWKGQVRTIDEWSEALDIPVKTIKARLRQKWDTDAVLSLPFPCGPVVRIKGKICALSALDKGSVETGR